MLGSTSPYLHSTWLLLSLFFFEDSPEDDVATGVCWCEDTNSMPLVPALLGNNHADIKSNQGTCSCGRVTPVYPEYYVL